MRHLKRTVSGFWASALVVLLLTSCQGKNAAETLESDLERFPVSGEVSVGTLPLPRGVIAFQPLNRPGVVTERPVVDGKFEMSKPEGLPAGRYEVRFLPLELPMEEFATTSPDILKKIAAGRRMIPDVYQQEGALKVEIKEKASNPLKFDLSNAPSRWKQ